jgi:hypothetical protein
VVETSSLAPEVMSARLGRIEKRSDALQLPRLLGEILHFLYITQPPIKHILKTEVRNLVPLCSKSEQRCGKHHPSGIRTGARI